MSITVTNHAGENVVYLRYRLDDYRAEYVSANNSDLDKDQLILESRLTGASLQSFGNRRSTFKFIDTIQAPVPNSTDTVAKDAKVEVNFSLPAGMQEEAILDFMAKAKALFTDTTMLTKLVKSGQIDF